MNRKKKNRTFALGTAISLSLAATPAFTAVSASPFQTQTLKSPYLAKADKAESKPVETMKSSESKSKDGKCGDKKMKDGKCGGDKKAKEMKCGEGTCGGKK